MSTATEVTRGFIDACGAAFNGDVGMDSVLAFLAEDVVLHEADSVPYPGEFIGHEGFTRVATGFNAAWELRGPLEFTVVGDAGDRAVALIRADVTARATGRPFDLRFAEVYTVRDGKIVDIDIYYRDTAAITEVTAGVKVT